MTRTVRQLMLALLTAPLAAASADAQFNRPNPPAAPATRPAPASPPPVARPTAPVQPAVRPTAPPAAPAWRPAPASAPSAWQPAKPTPGPAAPPATAWKPSAPPVTPSTTAWKPSAPPTPSATAWKPSGVTPPAVRPAGGVAWQPTKPATPAWKPTGPAAKFALSGTDNAWLNSTRPKVDPDTRAALDAALAGKLLTRDQVTLLRAASKDSTIPLEARGAINSALQEDAQEKRRLANNNPPVYPQPVYPAAVYPQPVYPVPVVVEPAPVVVPVQPAPVATPAQAEQVQPAQGPPPADATPYGLVVGDTPTGPAAAAGLKANDLIVSVAGVRVQSPADLQAVLDQNDGRAVAVKYLDGETGAERQTQLTSRDGQFGAKVAPDPAAGWTAGRPAGTLAPLDPHARCIMSDNTFHTEALRPLLTRVQAGDPAAEDELIRAARGRLEALARRMLRRFPAVARWVEEGDVFSGGAMRLLRAARTVQVTDTRHFLNLAAAAMRRELIDLTRRHYGPHGVGANHDTAAPSNDPPPDPPAPDAGADELERWAALHAAVDRLPAELREVFGLVYYHRWTQAQVAELFGVDERTVRRRWQAAGTALTAALGGEMPDMGDEG